MRWSSSSSSSCVKSPSATPATSPCTCSTTATSSPTRNADKERRVIPDDLAVRLQSKADVMPTCIDYKRLLELAAKRTTIPMEVLRSAFGLYTYAQWAAVFNL